MPGFDESRLSVIEDVSHILAKRAEEQGGPVWFTRHLLLDYGKDQLVLPLLHLAEAIEPADPVLGNDPEMPRKNGFLRGGIVGYKVIEEAFRDQRDEEGHNTFLHELIGTIVANDLGSQITDPHEQAEALLAYGHEGFNEAVDPNARLVATWEPALSADLLGQAAVRSGFGVVMHVALDIIEAKADELVRELYAHQVIAGINWDTVIQDLAGER